MLRRTTWLTYVALLTLATHHLGAARAQTRIGDSITAALETEAQHDREPFGYRVLWIDFDSPFRQTDLQIGDLIIGVDEVRYRREDFQKRRAVGDTAESEFWRERGARDAQPVTLTVLRDGQELQIRGALHANRFYYAPGDRPALQEGGPDRMRSDGFESPWSSWYEKFTKSCSYVLDDGWERLSFNNRQRLAEHLELEPRVKYLAQHYPGPLATSVVEDWTRVLESLRGKLVSLTEQDLAYRTMGEIRVKDVARAALAAREALLSAVRPDSIDAFPALDPIAGDRSAVVGKVVELPAVGMERMINDLGRSFFVIGDREGHYFVDCNDPDMELFFGAYFRYRGLVDPAIRETFSVIGRIRDDPRMLTFREMPVNGMTLDVLGVTVADQLFVDLRPLKGHADPSARPTKVDFAGESELRALPSVRLDDASSPEEVMTAFVTAIKTGDYDRWRSFFADWQILERADGSAIFIPSSDEPEGNFASAWERSRKLILSDVYDVRVEKVSPVRAMVAADPATSLPRVEQVVLFIDHFGLFDGEYRSFVDVRVTRRWVLQRVGDGPWRILAVHSL